MVEGVANKAWSMDDEGYVVLPDAPGFGVEIDEEKAIAVGNDPKNQFAWEDHRLRDGSVADY